MSNALHDIDLFPLPLTIAGLTSPHLIGRSSVPDTLNGIHCSPLLSPRTYISSVDHRLAG
jgi:hypothetical protein